MPKKKSFLFLKSASRAFRDGEKAVDKLHYKTDKAIREAAIDVCATAIPIILKAKDKVEKVHGVFANAAVQASLFQLGGEPALQLWELARMHFGVDAGSQIVGALSGNLDISIPDALSPQPVSLITERPLNHPRVEKEDRSAVGIAYDECGAWLAVYAGAVVRDGLKVAREISGVVAEAGARASLFQLGGDPAVQLREMIKTTAGLDAAKFVPQPEIAIPSDIKNRLAKMEMQLTGNSPGVSSRSPGM